MLERMAHSKAFGLCGTPTAPSDLIERQGADETLTRMGAGVGQVGDGIGRLAVQVDVSAATILAVDHRGGSFVPGARQVSTGSAASQTRTSPARAVQFSALRHRAT